MFTEAASSVPDQAPAAAPSGPAGLDAGSPEYRRVARAFFFGGFATFAMIYGLQPLMPLFAAHFAVTPAAASGVISAATGGMALCLIPASILADRFGRKPVMNASLAITALLTLAAAFVSDFRQLLVLRALFGIALAGLPAVAMAYLSEEINPKALGRAMGLYIAGNALGGMSARLFSAWLADWFSWRCATAVLGVLGLCAAVEFWRSLPASRNFQTQRFIPAAFFRTACRHLAVPGLRGLYALGFLLMGSFISFYNYLGFRLSAPPFELRTGLQGLVFSFYICGMVSSAWAGALADRLGRHKVLWMMVALMGLGLALTLGENIAVLMVGVALVTFGFFAAHSVASSGVGQLARGGKALASALYLSAYYLGSSLLGSGTGLMWNFGGWSAIVALLAGVLAISLVIALRLRAGEATADAGRAVAAQA